MCCHTETEIVGQTRYLTKSQCADTGPTSPALTVQCQAPSSVATGVMIFQVCGMADTETKIETDRRTDRRTDRQTDRQTDRRMDRQTDREREGGGVMRGLGGSGRTKCEIINRSKICSVPGMFSEPPPLPPPPPPSPLPPRPQRKGNLTAKSTGNGPKDLWLSKKQSMQSISNSKGTPKVTSLLTSLKRLICQKPKVHKGEATHRDFKRGENSPCRARPPPPHSPRRWWRHGSGT